MSYEELIDGLTNDADLRAEFRNAPHEVVAQHDIELNDEQEERLKAEDWHSMTDDELVDQVSGHPGLRAYF